jgi:hypothetical protein
MSRWLLVRVVLCMQVKHHKLQYNTWDNHMPCMLVHICCPCSARVRDLPANGICGRAARMASCWLLNTATKEGRQAACSTHVAWHGPAVLSLASCGLRPLP